MTSEDEEFERIAQKQLAALKKSTRATTEDAAVRAVYKVMAEFDAKSDPRLMEMPNSSMAWQEGYEAGRLAERERLQAFMRQMFDAYSLSSDPGGLRNRGNT